MIPDSSSHDEGRPSSTSQAGLRKGHSESGLPSSFTHRGYRVRAALEEEPARQILEAILDQAYTTRKVFKDSRATYAARLQLGEDSLVLKVPRARLRRKWEKFVTLVRDSESFRTFKNLRKMHELGFKAPLPLLAGEKRVKGFVVDSFCCYRFEEGRPAGPDDAQAVMRELLKLHARGYLRTDAKAPNFLISDQGITFIDFRLKKPFLFRGFKKDLELARLNRVYPESAAFLPGKTRRALSYRLAVWAERKSLELKQARRRLKSALKPK